MSEKTVAITICNKSYNIRTENDPNYTQNIAQKLDEKYKEVFAENEGITLLDAAVLTGLDLLDVSVRLEANLKHARDRAKEYAQELSNQLKETEKARRENEKLKKELQKIKTELQAEIQALQIKEKAAEKKER